MGRRPFFTGGQLMKSNSENGIRSSSVGRLGQSSHIACCTKIYSIAGCGLEITMEKNLYSGQWPNFHRWTVAEINLDDGIRTSSEGHWASPHIWAAVLVYSKAGC